MKARMVREDAQTYEMHDGQRSFRVPKQGLSADMHAKIRAMGAPQGYAQGGGIPTRTLDLISGSVADNPLAALPLSAFSLPTVPGPSMEGIPPPRAGDQSRSMTGAELGLGGGFSPDAQVELSLPRGQADGMPGATPSMAAAARKAGLPYVAGARVAPEEESVQTLVQTGTTPDGKPIVEPREGNIIKDIPGLRLKPTAEGTAPTSPGPTASAGPKMPGMPGSGQSQFDEATKEGLAAANAHSQAEIAQARAKAEGLAEIGRVADKTALERKEVSERARQRVEGAMTKVQAAQDEVARIDTSVDPGRFWASRSTGDKVLGILGLVLGAVGAGNDGVNRAAGMMQQAIDRDLDAQKSEHELRLRKGGAGVEAAKSFYAMASQASGDELSAFDLSRSMALDSAANKAAQLEAATGEPMAKARLGAMRAALKTQAAEQRTKAQQQMFENGIKQGMLDVERQKSAAAAGKKDGPSADAIKTAAEVRERAQNIRTSLDQADSLIQKYGTFEMTGPQQSELGKALNDVATDMAKLKDPASAARESEVDNELNNLGFKAGSLTTSNATARELIRNYRQSVDRREAEGLRVRGFAK